MPSVQPSGSPTSLPTSKPVGKAPTAETTDRRHRILATTTTTMPVVDTSVVEPVTEIRHRDLTAHATEIESAMQSRRIFTSADSASANAMAAQSAQSRRALGAAEANATLGAIVSINGMYSVCTDVVTRCNFQFIEDNTPHIYSMAVRGGKAYITGDKLLPPLSVWFGTVPVDNKTIVYLDQSHQNLSLAVPPQTAGPTSLFMHTAYGNVLNAWSFTYLNKVAVNRVIPQYGSLAGGSTVGGNTVTIVGNGFSPTLRRNVVLFGTQTGVVVSANYTRLVVLTPAPAAAVSTTSTVAVQVSVLDPLRKMVLDSVTVASAYTYSAALTPSITSVTPSTVTAGKVITIAGSGFGADGVAGNGVMIGGIACVVTTWSDASIVCAVGATAAGTHPVQVTSGVVGLAKASTTSANLVTIALTLSSLSTTSVGPGGGATVTIKGSGFASTSVGSSSNVVSVCGINAPVTQANSTSLTFTAPAMQTAKANDLYNTYEVEVLTPTIGGSVSCSGSCTKDTIFDGSAATEFAACDASTDLGPNAVAVVTKLRFFPKLNDLDPFRGSTFYAGNSASGPWTTLYSVPTTGIVEGWNYKVS
jgi:IPT/TIG domain